MPDNVQWIDLGLEKILKNISFLDKTKVEIGIVGEAAQRPSADGRLTIGEVALINEYGSRSANIPPRHFIKSALHTPVAMQVAERVARAGIEFGNVDAALEHAGERLAEVMRNTIYSGNLTPNADTTVRKKGFNHPLLETSELADAIGYQLVRGGGGVVDAGAALGGFEEFHVSGGSE